MVSRAIAKAHQFTPTFPASDFATIEFSISQSSVETKIDIFDLSGRRIATLPADNVSSGEQSITWNCGDSNGIKVPAGIYILRVTAGGENYTKKVLVLK